MFRMFCACALLLLMNVLGIGPALAAPSPVKGLRYDAEFAPGEVYDASVPTAESIIGFRIGDRAARYSEIEQCLRVWAQSSDRMRLVQYATTHEGRALYYVVISSPANIANLDRIKRGMAQLADPHTLSDQEADRLIASLPAVAWIAHSIHGDETSGVDSALALIHHFIAATNDDIRAMLDEMVIVIDPMMNPDGRARFLQQIAENRGVNPNLDDQSPTHRGVWPEGRGNHYFFDLNRDWIYGVHPETRGRIKAVREWRPLLFVDAHEMDPQDTYLFSPPREPLNPFHPTRRRAWGEVFARDQAAAFDRHGWRYYSGEWNDNWYPGYSDAWASLGGAIGILYEQAGIADAGVRRFDGTVMPYRRTVHQQFTSALANLDTLRRNRELLLNQLLLERRHNLDGEAHRSRVYAFTPSPNAGRMNDFRSLLDLQGIEAFVTTEDVTVSKARDRLGRDIDRCNLPAGTILVPAAQPDAPLVQALFEFDPRMSDVALQEERRDLLLLNESRQYDVSAWNLPMMFDLETHILDTGMPESVRPLQSVAPAPGGVDQPQATVGFVVSGHDDRSVALAARLLERGVQVRVADRDFEFDGVAYPRGSVLIARDDNRNFDGELVATLETVCKGLGVRAVGFKSGQAPGDLPDFGGWHFRLLNRPRIAILSRGDTRRTTVGEVWHEIDQKLGVRSTLLDIKQLPTYDLRRYNVMVVPDSYDEGLTAADCEMLKEWTRDGGTLIAIGGGVAPLIHEEAEFSAVRDLSDVLDNLDTYRIAVAREWLGRTETLKADGVWSHVVSSAPPDPIPHEPPVTDEKKLQRIDQWQSIFMPGGAFVAGRVDDQNWITAGAGDVMPVIVGRAPVLMVAEGARAAIRLGAIFPTQLLPALPPDKQYTRQWTGWASIPAGYELRLRMSGLLWPEAAQRIAHSAWLTTEAFGNGQVILFATPPAFRGAARGTARLLHNALVYGPGFASSHIIEP